MKFKRTLRFSIRQAFYHLRNFPRNHIGGDADDSVSADCHERQCEHVIAAQNFKAWSQCRAQLADAIGIAAGFFDADDIFAFFGEALHGLNCNFDSATARNAVEDDWDTRATSHFAEMLEKAFLRWFIVIGRNLEGTIRADFFGVLGKIDRFGGGVASRAGEHLEFARGKFHRELDDFNVLVVIDGGRFAGRADRHDSVDASLDLNFDQSLERGFINFAIFKWRDYCSVSSSKHFLKPRFGPGRMRYLNAGPLEGQAANGIGRGATRKTNEDIGWILFQEQNSFACQKLAFPMEPSGEAANFLF